VIPPATLRERAALRVLQGGALAVVLAAAPYKTFDLDRFFVPKELVLHVTALLATLLLVPGARRLGLRRADQLLGLFLALGAASALFATNWWLAGRALGVSLSGLACFWCARSLARAGLGRPLLAAFALAGVVGAATSLLQAYGVRTEYVSLNRAPGGTFGNRNFMAHVSVIVMPALVLVATVTPTRKAYGWWAFGVALVSGALVLSRSRAAWLALLAGAVVLVPCAIMALSRGRGALRLGRLILLPVAAALGAYAALVLPNTLDWRSDSPYLDTARSVVNYKQGSGHGRLVQYGSSLRMSLHHPLFGVGPGNWAVTYPRVAAADDPSLTDEGMTANPWPSSDWMAFVSERGAAAFVLLGLALLALVADGMRAVRRAPTPEERLQACALLATVVIVVVAGAFDAVLLLPAPALIAWSLFGALSPPSRERASFALPIPLRMLMLAGVAALGALSVGRSGAQLAAMAIFNRTSRSTPLERASALDPGSYRIHVRLAQDYLQRGDCARVRAHAGAARDLFPNAAKPKRLLASCGH
jgi:hypothetical protein